MRAHFRRQQRALRDEDNLSEEELRQQQLGNFSPADPSNNRFANSSGEDECLADRNDEDHVQGGDEEANDDEQNAEEYL